MADYLDALAWVREIGGLPAAIGRSQTNLETIDKFVADSQWIDFLAAETSQRSNTSICLSVDLPGEKVKYMVGLLDDEGGPRYRRLP